MKKYASYRVIYKPKYVVHLSEHKKPYQTL